MQTYINKLFKTIIPIKNINKTVYINFQTFDNSFGLFAKFYSLTHIYIKIGEKDINILFIF